MKNTALAKRLEGLPLNRAIQFGANVTFFGQKGIDKNDADKLSIEFRGSGSLKEGLVQVETKRKKTDETKQQKTLLIVPWNIENLIKEIENLRNLAIKKGFYDPSKDQWFSGVPDNSILQVFQEFEINFKIFLEKLSKILEEKEKFPQEKEIKMKAQLVRIKNFLKRSLKKKYSDAILSQVLNGEEIEGVDKRQLETLIKNFKKIEDSSFHFHKTTIRKITQMR